MAWPGCVSKQARLNINLAWGRSCDEAAGDKPVANLTLRHNLFCIVQNIHYTDTIEYIAHSIYYIYNLGRLPKVFGLVDGFILLSLGKDKACVQGLPLILMENQLSALANTL